MNPLARVWFPLAWLIRLFLVALVGCSSSSSEPVAPQDAGTCTPTVIDSSTPSDACVPQIWFFDDDGDGWGSSTKTPVLSCTRPPGFTDNPLDCADEDSRAFPGQGLYYVTPIQGERTGGTPEFDFNCDGTDEYQGDAGVDAGLALCTQEGCK